MTKKTEKVTPELAAQYLERSRCEYRLDIEVVGMLARAMVRGRWLPQAQTVPLYFDNEGVLVSGQHLLRAVVEAEATVELVVVREKP